MSRWTDDELVAIQLNLPGWEPKDEGSIFYLKIVKKGSAVERMEVDNSGVRKDAMERIFKAVKVMEVFKVRELKKKVSPWNASCDVVWKEMRSVGVVSQVGGSGSGVLWRATNLSAMKNGVFEYKVLSRFYGKEFTNLDVLSTTARDGLRELRDSLNLLLGE